MTQFLVKISCVKILTSITTRSGVCVIADTHLIDVIIAKNMDKIDNCGYFSDTVRSYQSVSDIMFEVTNFMGSASVQTLSHWLKQARLCR